MKLTEIIGNELKEYGLENADFSFVNNEYIDRLVELVIVQYFYDTYDYMIEAMKKKILSGDFTLRSKDVKGIIDSVKIDAIISIGSDNQHVKINKVKNDLFVTLNENIIFSCCHQSESNQDDNMIVTGKSNTYSNCKIYINPSEIEAFRLFASACNNITKQKRK